ncbi:hypothetical protein H9L10_09050 [Phycicoccus endophyticus]|uniref:Uncharacterized protein n=1 Tax=Phycicoccus endophyticus TaxID=1690220 RepID=A0A7G9QYQ8_9MICO|nr:hypothetical protein [Phycicoccus endophyticus]QNN48483.1 hypothetical protein H9L10_09050 [Phycicoccus endophyticus]
MTPLFRRPARLVAALVLALGVAALVPGLLQIGDLADLVGRHGRTLAVVVGLVVLGELVRVRMPSGREISPLSSASAMAAVFLGPVAGEPTFDPPAGLVVVVVAAGLLIAAVVRRARHQPAGLSPLAARLTGVGVAVELTRGWGSPSLWAALADPGFSRGRWRSR